MKQTGLWVLVVWGLLASRAHAQPTPVHVPHPTTLTWMTHFEGESDGPPQTVTSGADGVASIDLTLPGRYHFTGVGPSDRLLWRYQVDEDYSAAPGVSITLRDRSVPDPVRIAILGICAAAAVAVGLSRTGRRLKQEKRQLETREAAVAASQATAGLFPTDGSLPKSIPPYRVVDRLGSGGMAIVYRVENEAGETFALKLPLPNLLSDAKYMQRFKREAKIGLRLRHPNLVSLLYVNDEQNAACPWPYLVMELVNGTSFDRILDERHQLPEPEAVAVILDVLAGLEVVHQHGIVHRDIKPGNVMITPSGMARLMDFGVAHRQETMGGKLTGTEEIVGTPLYMAPEQVATRPLDGRCDIYSVGIMFYEMLAGDVPYGTNDTYVILGLKCTMPLPPLASRCAVSTAVADLVDRMVALEPDDRPASVGEIRAILDAHLTA